jgi:hypothetical protein
MMVGMRRAVLVLFFVGWGSATSLAQPAGAQAEVLFREGHDLMTAGKYAEACAAFEQSQKLDPATATLLNLASCREKGGQLATAWGLFLEAERQTRAGKDGPTRQLHDVAQGHAKKLEARVSKLTINVPQKSQVDGLEIIRDQDRVDAVMWNRAMPMDGGTYRISARAPGANTWSTEITIAAEGDSKTVEIPDLRNLSRDLVPPVASEPAAAPAAHDPVVAIVPAAQHDEVTAAATPGGDGHAVALAVGGGAVVLLGGALGASLWGDSTYDRAKAETDLARRDALYDSANTRRYVADGLAIAGVACAGVAVWLYLRAPDDEHAAASARRHQVVISPTGIAVMGAF